MTAKEFQKLVTDDKSDFLDRFLGVLQRLGIDYCMIGGLAVNAYAEPLVTLDCDVVVVASRIEELEREMRQQCRVERFAHSRNLTDPQSKVRIQIQTDEFFQRFLSRRRPAEVLERSMYVACPEDLIASKIAAFQEPQRRESKRLKDLVDIKRLIEVFPELKSAVPQSILQRISL